MSKRVEAYLKITHPSGASGQLHVQSYPEEEYMDLIDRLLDFGFQIEGITREEYLTDPPPLTLAN